MSLSLLSSESDDVGMRRDLDAAAAELLGLLTVLFLASSLDDDDDSESDDVRTVRDDLLAAAVTREADSVEHLRLASVEGRDISSSSVESCTRDLPTLLRRRLLAYINHTHRSCPFSSTTTTTTFMLSSTTIPSPSPKYPTW